MLHRAPHPPRGGGQRLPLVLPVSPLPQRSSSRKLALMVLLLLLGLALLAVAVAQAALFATHPRVLASFIALNSSSNTGSRGRFPTDRESMGADTVRPPNMTSVVNPRTRASQLHRRQGIRARETDGAAGGSGQVNQQEQRLRDGEDDYGDGELLLLRQSKEETRGQFATLRNLIVVAGHAVFIAAEMSLAAASLEASWYLEQHQRIAGQAESFVEHVRAGATLLREDPRALLLFSGGQTRKEAGARSEGASYWAVGEVADWFVPLNLDPAVRSTQAAALRARALTEEGARDSFENLLFSLCRFRQVTGHYPDNITVVGYDFKRARFEQLHREALRFPAERFFYVGTPAPSGGSDEALVARRLQSEAAVRQLFEADPFGCSTPELVEKRLARDPFHRSPAYGAAACPEMRPLMQRCESQQRNGNHDKGGEAAQLVVPWAGA